MGYKFKIGDRVKVLDGSNIDDYTGGWCAIMFDYCGETATVIARESYRGKRGYHLKSDNEKFNTFVLFDERGIKMANEEKKIVITTDGTTTRAALYDGHKLIKEAKAICGKDDTFCFETGAKIAFERLIEKPEEPKPKKALKLLNTKIFVIDGYDDFKSGHIYEIKDGKIKDDEGWRYPLEGSFYNMDDVHKYFDNSEDVKYNSVGDTLSGYTTSKQVKVMEVKED